MKSFPYNVILSKDPKDVRTMFFGLGIAKASFDKFFTDENFSSKLNTSLLISQRNNRGFIEMEFDKAYSQGKMQVMMKFVETSEILEYFAFDTDPVEGLVKKKIKSQITHTKSDQARERLVAEFADYSTTFYLAFGMGDNPKNWTGPLSMSLTNAHLSIREDGIREAEFIFTIDPNSYKLYHNMSLQSHAKAVDSVQYGKALNDTRITKATSVFKHDGTKPYYNPYGYSWNFTLRDLLRKYLSEIYTDSPIGNILPLFSKDLDQTGEAKNSPINTTSFEGGRNIEDLSPNLKQFGVSVENLPSKVYKVESTPMPESTQKVMNSKGFKSSPSNPSTASPAASPANSKDDLIDFLIDNPFEAIPANKGITDDERTFIVLERDKLKKNITVPQVNGGGDGGEGAGLNAPEDPRLADGSIPLEYRLSNVDNAYVRREMALELRLSNKSRINDLRARRANKDAIGDLQDNAVVKSTQSNANPDAGMETDTDDTSERKPGEAKITMAAVDVAGKGSVTDALNQFARGLIATRDKQTDIVLTEESDLFILRNLKKFGLIENENAPVILFGEREIIRNLIYTISTGSKESLEVSLPKNMGVITSYQESSSEDLKNAWKQYIKATSEDYEGRGNTSCYREKAIIGDDSSDFGYEDGMITFMHNVKNSNILNIELDDKTFFTYFKSLLVDSDIRTHANNIKAAQILKETVVDLEEIAEYLKLTMSLFQEESSASFGLRGLPTNAGLNTPSQIKSDLIQKLYSKEDKELLKLIRAKSKILDFETMDFIDIITFLVQGKTSKDLIESVGTVQVTEHTQVGRTYADLITDFRRLTRQIRIKTLPFFNQGPRLWYSPCFVYALGNSIKGAIRTQDVSKTPTFFSGGYRITGFRHVISNSESYSEFKLTKDDSNSNNPIGAKIPKKLGDFIGKSREELRRENPWMAETAEEARQNALEVRDRLLNPDSTERPPSTEGENGFGLRGSFSPSVRNG
jgi:hypothetical protein